MPTDGISGHLYVSQSVVCEMVTVQESALCLGWLFETKSVTQTQRNYRTQLNKPPPSDYAIRDWQRCFLETGSVHDRKRSGRPGVSEECVETTRASFVRSPSKSTRPNRMWLAQFICAPQCFKTPSGLCGHTVYGWINNANHILSILYLKAHQQLLYLNICSFVRQCNTFTSQTLSTYVCC
jgi:hypothetical protein